MSKSSKSKATFLDKCFKDSSDNLAIFQWPNLPIIVWFVAMVITNFLPHETKIHALFNIIAFGTLFTWAWLEVFSGTNYFRRALGALVLLFLILSRSNIL